MRQMWLLCKPLQKKGYREKVELKPNLVKEIKKDAYLFTYYYLPV